MGSGGGRKEELCNPYEDAGRIYGAVCGGDTIGKPAESLQARGPPAGVLRPVKRGEMWWGRDVHDSADAHHQ